MSPKDEQIARLGPPDITLAGLQIWVHGRQFPDAHDYWDGNWLRVTAHCGGNGASVFVSGPFIHLGEIDRWLTAIQTLQQDLKGEAKLDCMETELSVDLKFTSLGHIDMEVQITPDQFTQRHWFRFGIDQTYLAPLID